MPSKSSTPWPSTQSLFRETAFVSFSAPAVSPPFAADAHLLDCLPYRSLRLASLLLIADFILPPATRGRSCLRPRLVRFFETASHWVIIGLDKDLNAAMTLAARNVIKFLAAQAKISDLDAYALCSVAVSFRVTQVVDIVRGVHALIPKTIFAPDLRREMTMV